MTELKDLLELALSDGPGPAPAQPADPAADLARGRRLLRRRRLTQLTGGAAVVAIAALVPLAAGAAGTGSQPHPGAAAQATGSGSPVPARAASPAAAGAAGLALVAYTGQQPPGYRVAEVPQGWVIQGGDPYVLTLAPRDDKNTNYQVFTGKLVVMLQSAEANAPTQGTPQPVAGHPGRFDVQGSTQVLTYQDPAGQWVVIQAPTSLGWDSARLAQFAAGVQVLGNAQQGHG